jgi:hypothetical protein
MHVDKTLHCDRCQVANQVMTRDVHTLTSESGLFQANNEKYIGQFLTDPPVEKL